MPQINIEYDDEKLNESEILILSNGIQKIISEVTNIKDVFVYANTAKIKIQIAPIEIFVRMSSHIMEDPDKLMLEIKNKISSWKQENIFHHLINLTLIPMNWKVEIGL